MKKTNASRSLPLFLSYAQLVGWLMSGEPDIVAKIGAMHTTVFGDVTDACGLSIDDPATIELLQSVKDEIRNAAIAGKLSFKGTFGDNPIAEIPPEEWLERDVNEQLKWGAPNADRALYLSGGSSSRTPYANLVVSCDDVLRFQLADNVGRVSRHDFDNAGPLVAQPPPSKRQLTTSKRGRPKRSGSLADDDEPIVRRAIEQIIKGNSKHEPIWLEHANEASGTGSNESKAARLRKRLKEWGWQISSTTDVDKLRRP